MSLPKKIINNTMIQMVGRVTTALMALISIKLITTSIGVEGYGMYTTVYEFLALFAIAGDFGIYTVALKEMASKLERGESNKKSDEVSYIYQNILGLRIVLMIICLFAGIVASFMINKYKGTLIPYGVMITSLTVFANLINSTVTSILQLHLKMTYATYSLILGKIVGVLLIAYGAFFMDSKTTMFFMFLVAGIFGNLSMLGLSLFYAKKFTNIMPKFDLDYWSHISKKSAPYGVALILGTIYFKIDVLFISLLRNNEEVGIYAIGLRIIEVFTVFPIFFMNSVLPSLTRAISKGKEKVENLMQFSFQFLALTGIPLVLGVTLVSKFVVKTVSSEEFISGGKFALGGDVALILLMIAMLFSFFSNFISISLVAFERQKKVLFINALGVTINIILNAIYIPKYGFIAAGFTSIISEAFIFVFGIILFQRTYKFIPNIIPIIKIIIAGIIMFGTGYLLKSIIGEGNVQDLILIITCIITYSLLIWIFRVVKMKNWSLISE